MSLYGYADGDPVNFSDPFGLCPRRVFAGVRGGAAAGGVVGTVVPGVGTVAGTIVR